jgi:hypothetical protein
LLRVVGVDVAIARHAASMMRGLFLLRLVSRLEEDLVGRDSVAVRAKPVRVPWWRCGGRVERDFFRKRWAMSRPERLALVDHDDQAVPVVAQCRLLKVARSTLYYDRAHFRAPGVPVLSLAISGPAGAGQHGRSGDDAPHWWIVSGVTALWIAADDGGQRREGWPVNRKRVRRLMRVMALEAIYQKPDTSRKHPDYKV